MNIQSDPTLKNVSKILNIISIVCGTLTIVIMILISKINFKFTRRLSLKVGMGIALLDALRAVLILINQTINLERGFCTLVAMLLPWTNLVYTLLVVAIAVHIQSVILFGGSFHHHRKKFYWLGVILLSSLLVFIPLVSGRFGRDSDGHCSYSDPDTVKTYRWEVGTYLFWVFAGVVFSLLTGIVVIFKVQLQGVVIRNLSTKDYEVIPKVERLMISVALYCIIPLFTQLGTCLVMIYSDKNSKFLIYWSVIGLGLSGILNFIVFLLDPALTVLWRSSNSTQYYNKSGRRDYRNFLTRSLNAFDPSNLFTKKNSNKNNKKKKKNPVSYYNLFFNKTISGISNKSHNNNNNNRSSEAVEIKSLQRPCQMQRTARPSDLNLNNPDNNQDPSQDEFLAALPKANFGFPPPPVHSPNKSCITTVNRISVLRAKRTSAHFHHNDILPHHEFSTQLHPTEILRANETCTQIHPTDLSRDHDSSQVLQAEIIRAYQTHTQLHPTELSPVHEVASTPVYPSSTHLHPRSVYPSQLLPSHSSQLPPPDSVYTTKFSHSRHSHQSGILSSIYTAFPQVFTKSRDSSQPTSRRISNLSGLFSYLVNPITLTTPDSAPSSPFLPAPRRVDPEAMLGLLYADSHIPDVYESITLQF